MAAAAGLQRRILLVEMVRKRRIPEVGVADVDVAVEVGAEHGVIPRAELAVPHGDIHPQPSAPSFCTPKNVS